MAYVIPFVVRQALDIDFIGMKTVGEYTVYTFKTSGIAPKMQEIKAKILSVLDFPLDIPVNIVVKEVKKGKLFKEYEVEMTVHKEKIGKASDLLASRYGLRRREYSGTA